MSTPPITRPVSCLLSDFIHEVPSLPELAKMANHFFANDLHRGRRYTETEIDNWVALQNLLADLGPLAPLAGN